MNWTTLKADCMIFVYSRKTYSLKCSYRTTMIFFFCSVIIYLIYFFFLLTAWNIIWVKHILRTWLNVYKNIIFILLHSYYIKTYFTASWHGQFWAFCKKNLSILLLFNWLELFFVPLENSSLIWSAPLPVMDCKFWPMLGTHGHWAVRFL